MAAPFRRRRYASPGGVVLLLLVPLIVLRLSTTRHEGPGPDTLQEGNYVVQRVVDGDTLLLTNDARIRLLGVDTPETKKPDTPVQPWGPEATEFTEQFIDSHPVELRMDRERTDRYGRFLAYVYVEGKFLNEELARAGLARVLTQYHYSERVKKQLLKAQSEARAAHRGIWSGIP